MFLSENISKTLLAESDWKTIVWNGRNNNNKINFNGKTKSYSSVSVASTDTTQIPVFEESEVSLSFYFELNVFMLKFI